MERGLTEVDVLDHNNEPFDLRLDLRTTTGVG
jgi:hypothetical protein